MSKISITRALTEVKTLTDRINQAIAAAPCVQVTKGQQERKTVVGSAKSVDAVWHEILAGDQKVVDLITRRNTLKRAIIHSNHVTKVVISGEEMTVAEAVDRKQSIAFEQSYLQTLRQRYVHASNTVNTLNTKLNEEIERAVQGAYQNEKGKVSEDQYNLIANPRRKEHEANLLDPLDITKKIDAFNERVTGFLMEVDFVLSESNARTEIEV